MHHWLRGIYAPVNTIQHNIRLTKNTPVDTAATEITKLRIIKAVKQRHY